MRTIALALLLALVALPADATQRKRSKPPAETKETPSRFPPPFPSSGPLEPNTSPYGRGTEYELIRLADLVQFPDRFTGRQTIVNVIISRVERVPPGRSGQSEYRLTLYDPAANVTVGPFEDYSSSENLGLVIESSLGDEAVRQYKRWADTRARVTVAIEETHPFIVERFRTQRYIGTISRIEWLTNDGQVLATVP